MTMKNVRNEFISNDKRKISIQYIYDNKLWHTLELVDEQNNIWRFIPAQEWMRYRFIYDNEAGKTVYEGVDVDGLGMIIVVGDTICGKTVEEIMYERWPDGKNYVFIRFTKEDIPQKSPEKFPWQTCQDDELNTAFCKLHKEIVNRIIGFCNTNNIRIDEVDFSADGLSYSLEYGYWQPGTDSSMTMYKEKRSVKDIDSGKKPFLMSM